MGNWASLSPSRTTDDYDQLRLLYIVPHRKGDKVGGGQQLRLLNVKWIVKSGMRSFGQSLLRWLK